LTWQQTDLVVEQNSQLVESWLFFNSTASGNPGDYVPYDFTGATLKMQVRETEDVASSLLATFGTGTGEIVFISGTTNPGPAAPSYNNGFQLTIVAATSAGIAAGSYWYDLFMYVSGIPTRILAGAFTVVATQTR
jgi:hypothetical protein